MRIARGLPLHAPRCCASPSPTCYRPGALIGVVLSLGSGSPSWSPWSRSTAICAAVHRGAAGAGAAFFFSTSRRPTATGRRRHPPRCARRHARARPMLRGRSSRRRRAGREPQGGGERRLGAAKRSRNYLFGHGTARLAHGGRRIVEADDQDRRWSRSSRRSRTGSVQVGDSVTVNVLGAS